MRAKRHRELSVLKKKCVYCSKKKRPHQLPHCKAKKCGSPENCKDISGKVRKPHRNPAFKAISKKRRGRPRKQKTKAAEREELLKKVAIMKNEAPANSQNFRAIILREMERMGRQPASELKRAAENFMASRKKETQVQETPTPQKNVFPQSSGPCQVRSGKSQRKICKETMKKSPKRIDLKSKKISKNVANNISNFEKLLKKKNSSANLSKRRSISSIEFSPKPSQSSLETNKEMPKEDSKKSTSTVLSPKLSNLNVASQEPTVRSTFYLYPLQNTEDFITVEETRGEPGMETIFEARPSNKAMEDFLKFLRGAFLLSQQSKRNFRINL